MIAAAAGFLRTVLSGGVGDDAEVLDVVAFEVGFHYVGHLSVEEPDFWEDLGDEHAGAVHVDDGRQAQHVLQVQRHVQDPA